MGDRGLGEENLPNMNLHEKTLRRIRAFLPLADFYADKMSATGEETGNEAGSAPAPKS